MFLCFITHFHQFRICKFSPSLIFFYQGGDSTLKRIKADKNEDGNLPKESFTTEKQPRDNGHKFMPSTSSLSEPSIPNKTVNRNEILGFQQIPKQFLEMKIRDDTTIACHDEKVLYRYIEIIYDQNF